MRLQLSLWRPLGYWCFLLYWPRNEFSTSCVVLSVRALLIGVSASLWERMPPPWVQALPPSYTSWIDLKRCPLPARVSQSSLSQPTRSANCSFAGCKDWQCAHRWSGGAWSMWTAATGSGWKPGQPIRGCLRRYLKIEGRRPGRLDALGGAFALGWWNAALKTFWIRI